MFFWRNPAEMGERRGKRRGEMGKQGDGRQASLHRRSKGKIPGDKQAHQYVRFAFSG